MCLYSCHYMILNQNEIAQSVVLRNPFFSRDRWRFWGCFFLSFTGLLMCLPCVIPTCLSLCRCRPAVMGLKTPCCEFVIWVVFFFSPWGSNTLNAELSPTSISHYFPSHSRSRRNPHMRSHTMLCYYWQVFPIYLKMKQNNSFVEFHHPFNLAPSCANAHMWTLTRLPSKIR